MFFIIISFFPSFRVFQGPEKGGNRQQFRGVGKMGGVWARYPLFFIATSSVWRRNLQSQGCAQAQ
jgi:hypothetical protein